MVKKIFLPVLMAIALAIPAQSQAQEVIDLGFNGATSTIDTILSAAIDTSKAFGIKNAKSITLEMWQSDFTAGRTVDSFAIGVSLSGSAGKWTSFAIVDTLFPDTINAVGETPLGSSVLFTDDWLTDNTAIPQNILKAAGLNPGNYQSMRIRFDPVNAGADSAIIKAKIVIKK
jgi:hypothetical protein